MPRHLERAARQRADAVAGLVALWLPAGGLPDPWTLFAFTAGV